MKGFIQYLLARIGFWKPEVGAVYQADVKLKADPFKPNIKPTRVTVLAIDSGFVQFRWPSGDIDSTSVEGFAAYWVKVKT